MFKSPAWKKADPSVWGVEAQLHSQSLKIYQMELPLFTEVCVFRMWFSLNNLMFASDA